MTGREFLCETVGRALWRWWHGYKWPVALILLVLLAVPAAAQQPQDTKPEGRPGIGVDARGGQVIDPTENVKALNEASIKALRDLMDVQAKLFEAKLTANNEISALRSHYDRLLLDAVKERIDSEAKLRADFNERYAVTEKGRVDAIRLVDKNAVDVATAQAVATATALAKTVQDTAENSRKLVETTALETNRNIQTQFGAVSAQFTTIGTRLTALEQALAEGVGRSKFQDPNVERMNRLVETLVQTQSAKAGAGEGRGEVVVWIVGGLMLLFAFIGAIGAIGIMLARRKPATR